MIDTSEKLKQFLTLLNDSLTKEDFTNSFKVVLDLVKKAIQTLETKYQSAIQNIETKFDELSKKFIDNAIEDFNKLEKKVDDKLAKVKDGKDGADGKDGVNPDPNAVAVLASKLTVEEVLSKIPTIDAIIDNLLKQGDKIVSGLELRIDDIKDLKEKLEEIKKIKTTRQIFGGGGFNLGALNIHILDPYTPTGAVNGVNTDFVLTHAPNPTTSLKVYLDGQKMQLTTDYTLSGITLTFLTAPLTGSIIEVEHRI